MSQAPANKQSPLHSLHLELGGRMTPFAGWEMPVQFAGIMAEHKAVREVCGVFDISHMGQYIAEGSGVTKALDNLFTNKVAALEPGGGQYTLMLNEGGGVIDDLIIYRLADGERFLLVVNAAKSEEDAEWIRKHLSEGIEFYEAGADNGGLAVQGPEAPAAFTKLFGGEVELPERNGVVEFDVEGGKAYVCRTGYTGEDGYELFGPAKEARNWFSQLTEAGVTPCGLGSRDTLRLEMCYPLNGSDLSPDHSPIEAGLGFFVDLDKGEFIGHDVLAAQKQSGPDRRLVAIQFDGKSPPPRPHCEVIAGDETIGELSSATLSPSLRIGIGMGYLPRESAKIGTALEVEIRGRKFPVTVVKKPFLKK